MRSYFNFSAQQSTALWSGGTTTQLCIYPPEASFADRNFIFRISTATVEAETSVFTRLPGFHRILMILGGELTIQHKERYSKLLPAFATDEFEGEWETSSEGKVVDFNVIVSDKVKFAEVRKYEAGGNNTLTHEWNGADFMGIYILSGSMKINEQELNRQDFVLLQKETKHDSVNLTVPGTCSYVSVSIQMA